jgi:enoyl-CoA hydratase
MSILRYPYPEEAMPYETLLYEVHHHVATITLNRPKVLNALNAQVFDELEAIFTDMDRNSAVRAILITGAGEKSFAAGADINELALATATTGEQMALRGQSVFSLIESCGKPVIALINGFALGGGCELALACTVRFAASTAKLGQPEIKLGILPGYGGTQRLPRLVGRSAALRLLLTGDMISADEALRIGLVDEVHPADHLLARGQALAAQIVAAAPLAIAGTLEAVRRGAHIPLHEALRVEAEIFGQLCDTEDKAEGTAAFLAKRTPHWHGR